MQITNRFRLIADEGKILTDGEIKGYVVDIAEADVDKWSEVDDDEKTEENYDGNNDN